LFEITQIVPLVILIGVGIIFWWIGRGQLDEEDAG
jgi:hypothetical protein